MPVTAKLSRKFYETFGDEIANELVDWFNQVDLSYRGDLRELNELNFARFDAKLEQRLAESDARLEQRLAALDAKLERFRTDFDFKLDRLGLDVDVKLERLTADVDVRLERLTADVDAKLADLRAELIKWMFVFWIGTVAMMFLARAV